MKRLFKILGPIALAVGLVACAASSGDRGGVTSLQPTSGEPACFRPGDRCRWDNQCCSGRCYVDTGCNGPAHNGL